MIAASSFVRVLHVFLTKKFLVRIQLVFFLIGIVLAKLGGAEGVSPPGWDELFRGIVQSRKELQSGQVHVKMTISDVGESAVEWLWTLSFDGNKKRADIVRGGYQEVVCLNCYSTMTRFLYTTKPSPIVDGKMALTFDDGYDKESGIEYIPDPRWFGYVPMDIVNTQHFIPVLMYQSTSNRQGKSPTVTDVTFSNIPCWRVDYKQGNVDHSIWLSQSETSRVLCVEGRFSLDSMLFVDQVIVDDDLFEGKIYFPKTLHYKRLENGKVTRLVKTEIEVISLNQPLPADTFSPKGVSFLKPDTPVAWHLDRDRPFPEGELIWDGDNVVLLDAFGRMMQEPRQIGTVNMVLVFLGIACICFGVGRILYQKTLKTINE
jgi:hypothetical protein